MDQPKDAPEKPVYFTKRPTTVVSPGGRILKHSKLTQQLDWECELAVVIGKRGKGSRGVQTPGHVEASQ